MAGLAPGQATIEWRRLATDKHVSLDVATKLWEQAKTAAAGDLQKRSDLFRKLLDEAAKSPTASPEPGKANLVDQKAPNDPASLGPGKTTQVLLDKDQQPGVAKPDAAAAAAPAKDAAASAPPPSGKDAVAAKDAAAQTPAAPGAEAKKPDEAPTAKPTVDKVRNDLAAAAAAAKDVGAMLAEADPATIMEALRQLRDGDPALLHKLLTVAGPAIEARIGKKFPDPVANKVEGPVGVKVPVDGGEAKLTLSISDAGVPMIDAQAVSAKVAEWNAEIKKREAADQPVAQTVARVTALNATTTEQAKKAKDGDEAAKNAIEGTEKQLASELGNAARQIAQPPAPKPATDKSKHAGGPAPAGWREKVAATIASEKVVADDPGHTYHVLKTGQAVATSDETELNKPTADLAASKTGVVATPDPAANPEAPPGVKSPAAIQTAAPGALIGDPLNAVDKGHSVLSALSQGDATGLAPVGVQGELPFQSNSIEWGLDEWQPHNNVPTSGDKPGPTPTKTNVFRIIKGDRGGVLVMPNYVRHAHSHPARTPLNGMEQDKDKKPGSGSMKLDDLLKLPQARAQIMPSSSDVHYTFLHNVPQHIVHTPYRVDPQTLEVINPATVSTTGKEQKGGALAFVIKQDLFKKDDNGIGYSGTLIGTAGGAEVWRSPFSALALEHFGHAPVEVTGVKADAQQQQPQGNPASGGKTLAAQVPGEQQVQPQQPPAAQSAAPQAVAAQQPAAPPPAAAEPAAPQAVAAQQPPVQQPAAPQAVAAQQPPVQQPAAPQAVAAQQPAAPPPVQQPAAPQAAGAQLPAVAQPAAAQQAAPQSAAPPPSPAAPGAQAPQAAQQAPEAEEQPAQEYAEPIVEPTDMDGVPHTLKADPKQDNIEFNSEPGFAVPKLSSVVDKVAEGVRKFGAKALSAATEAVAEVLDPSLKKGGKPSKRPAAVKRVADKLKNLSVAIRLFGKTGKLKDATPEAVKRARDEEALHEKTTKAEANAQAAVATATVAGTQVNEATGRKELPLKAPQMVADVPGPDAIDPKHKATDQQKELGHAATEVHSHFMGNVPNDVVRETVAPTTTAPAPTAAPTPTNGPATDAPPAAQTDKPTTTKLPPYTSKWEGLLEQIQKIDPTAKGGIRHQKDENGKIKENKRGVAGDALDLVATAREKIAQKKGEREAAAGNAAKVKELEDQIDHIAELACNKALAASDETDFNSSYEVRDELIKSHYGNDDRAKVLGENGDVEKALEDTGNLLKHFEGRPEVIKKIQDASRIHAQLKAGNLPKDQKEKLTADLKTLKGDIHNQFAYDQYAKQTLKRLAEDDIKYTEQSNSNAKLGRRFDEQQLPVLKTQLISEQQAIIDSKTATPDEKEKAKKLQQQLQDLTVANLSMLNTASFGERDKAQVGPDAGKADGFANDEKQKRFTDEQFAAEVAKCCAQVGARKDVVGIDIAGAEHFRFDEAGAARFALLYNALRNMQAKMDPPTRLVLRPHVGEGATDPTHGDPMFRDKGVQVTTQGEQLHYERGRHNIEVLLTALEACEPLSPNIILRFGHVTHATPDQAARMKKFGIIAEVNLTSNVRTGAINQNPTGEDKPPEQQVPPPALESGPGRLEDHSLPGLIFAGTEVILSTDAHEVMKTSLKQEYDTAKKIIAEVVNNVRAVRVPLQLASQRGWSVTNGPPPHGFVYYRQMNGGEKARFDNALEKLYADANKYFDNRPKQNADGSGPTGPITPPAQGPSKPPGDTAAPPTTQEKQDLIEKQVRELEQLRKQLSSDKPDERTQAQGKLTRYEADPQWADALKMANMFQVAKSNQKAAEATETALLSENIPQVLAEQQKARTGKDPMLQAKRDAFERKIALAILEDGPVRKEIDAELKRLCQKAKSYLTKTRATIDEQEAALSKMHTDTSKGYGGGLGNENQTLRQRVDLMNEILDEGNIRERMLALSEFMKILGEDALNPAKRQQLKEMSKQTGPVADNEYSPRDAEKIALRAQAYDEANPDKSDKEKYNATNMFKPTEAESEGIHKDYAKAKSQDLDTKMPVMLASKVGAFLNRTIKAQPDGTVKKGDDNPLARTTITVREAIAQGLMLSKREIAACGGEDAQLNWVVGQTANMINPKAEFVQEAVQNSMPLKAGVSGTTYRWMQIVDMLGGDPKLARLAAIASLQAADAHSFHEIAVSAQGFGVDYSLQNPYANVGLPQAQLEAIAISVGAKSVAELSGQETPNADGGKPPPTT